MACDNCTTPDSPAPCLSCHDMELQMQSLCTEGCSEFPSSDCVLYQGDDIISSKLTIKKGDNMTAVVKQLSNNNLDVTIDISFNAATRQLCLSKNGTTVKCVTIPDQDDQYLKLNGSNLEIWKPGGTNDVRINSVNLATIFTETQLTFHSSSLFFTQAGTKGHDLTVNIVPSTDLGNSLKLGTDGKPYVPQQAQELSDVQIVNTDCLTWTKSYNAGKITYTPSLDWNCIASHVCPICVASSLEPINLNVTPA